MYIVQSDHTTDLQAKDYLFQENYGLAGFRKATDLKLTHPHLKVGTAVQPHGPHGGLKSQLGRVGRNRTGVCCVCGLTSNGWTESVVNINS